MKELERILGIDRATMTRLLAKLDMRRFELHSRPGDDREKVLGSRSKFVDVKHQLISENRVIETQIS